MCGCVGFGLLVIVRVRSFLVNFRITKTDSEEAVLFCIIIVWKGPDNYQSNVGQGVCARESERTEARGSAGGVLGAPRTHRKSIREKHEKSRNFEIFRVFQIFCHAATLCSQGEAESTPAEQREACARVGTR